MYQEAKTQSCQEKCVEKTPSVIESQLTQLHDSLQQLLKHLEGLKIKLSPVLTAEPPQDESKCTPEPIMCEVADRIYKSRKMVGYAIESVQSIHNAAEL